MNDDHDPSSNKPLNRYPIQWILIAVFVLLVLFTTAVTGYVSFINGQRAVNEVSRHLRNEITSRIQDHLAAFLANAHGINQLNASMIRQLKFYDVTALEHNFWNQIKIYSSVTSIYFGNTAGGMVNAGRENPAGDLYVISTDGFKKGPFRKFAIDNLGNPTRELLAIPDFDARTRPWYTGAVKKGEAAWSDICVLFTGQGMVTTASYPVYDQQQQLLGVVAVDLFLSHINDFLGRLGIGKTGQAFIMERSGLVVAESIPEKPFGSTDTKIALKRHHALDSQNPIVRYAAKALSVRFGEHFSITDTQHLNFLIQGKRHCLQVSPIKDKYDLDWLVVVVIPEADFMDQIHYSNRITLLLIVLSMMIAMGAGLIAAYWISHPMSQLNATAQALSRGEWHTRISDNSHLLEISELTKSFYNMTTQLQQSVIRLETEIVEHNNAEKALRSSEERLELVLKGANLGLWDWNIKTGKVIFNERWAEMIGYSLDEIEPNVSCWEKLMHPDDVDSVMDRLNDHLEGRTSHYQTEHRLRTKSGEWKWIFDSGKVFTRDEKGAPVRALGMHQDVTDRKHTEQRLHRALKEKEILLQEIHHRVKNNLAIISSMLNLQAKQCTDPKVRTPLIESQTRVMAMASIHETLYQTKDFSVIEFENYIRKIVLNLMSLYATDADHISIRYNIKEIHLDIDQAICCGLIVNELVTNALKYAFPDRRKGTIFLSSELMAEDEIVVSVWDDGVGIPQGLEWKTPRTLGLRLILLMVEQLKGKWEIISEQGLKTVIRWKQK
ncbi:hypothetical protein DSCO28_35430 [Desulfosarcina ovata subsp. sediminis]|uniref:histidine kinase n=1 Tax=Desulfosarcina ovata subsp. sediminis TaxID=885957 RepID=A0A5K7ZRY5_9BACT|nr:histidine kinase dimerization/phosphoacceptor domain -containing protein [Desulfosarcina ovata]BBO82977.1 hypothetical protein DSCO28_35430 [Desulfosarcina ovata subsp. sediminis]